MRGQSQEDALPRAQFHNNKNYGGDQILGLKLSGGIHCWFGNRLVAAVITGFIVGVAVLLVLAVGLALGLVLGSVARCCRSVLLSTPEGPDLLSNEVPCVAGVAGSVADDDPRRSACLHSGVQCCLVGYGCDMK
ncbi:hypothetical protein F5Y01DRAFT_101060 [Xylaria sp. FL0043]|nr:hypothetical protein F5Y01DRAFT_101060 [Xylaria sp. FL0043]